MSNLAILVRFRVSPGRQNEFLSHVAKNAITSVADEPGCHRFDVLTVDADAVGDVVLYEIYESPHAFDAHLQTPHFEAFRAATEGIVLSSTIERLVLHESAQAAEQAK